MRNNKFRFVVFAFALAFLASCGSPTQPSRCDDPNATNYGSPAACTYPRSGTINIVYQPQTACLSAGTEFAERCDRSKHPVTFGSIAWPDGYAMIGLQVVLQNDGSLTATATAPSSVWAGRLRITVADPWLCPLQSICSTDFTGKGITINGVRLADGDTETSFTFTPPDTVTR